MVIKTRNKAYFGNIHDQQTSTSMEKVRVNHEMSFTLSLQQWLNDVWTWAARTTVTAGKSGI